MRVDDEDGRYRREGCEVVETTYAAFTYTTQSVTAPAWAAHGDHAGPCSTAPGGCWPSSLSAAGPPCSSPLGGAFGVCPLVFGVGVVTGPAG
jgi:hypothetical protein